MSNVDFDLAFTPFGKIEVVDTSGECPSPRNDRFSATNYGNTARILAAIRNNPAEGLVALGGEPLDKKLPPSFAFWHGFASRYLAELCRTPEGEAHSPLPTPTRSEFAHLCLGLPPMHGAEYVKPEMLEALWQELNAWVLAEVNKNDVGVSAFLKKRAPAWHQVGRVCFHLAENHKDPEYPFAFLATYAARIGPDARLQYQPLSHALGQYAGAKNKSTLIRLLSPVQRAANHSPVVKELVDSGDLYHPLAWSSAQAHTFLLQAPSLEECGVTLRLPNWWKRRPRPRVSVRIGEKKQTVLDAKSMLEFRVELALGDEQLTEAELQSLMQSDEKLVLLRGQWVEVDKDKLSEALAHWQSLEKSTGGEISFVEGMRLLAGVSAERPDNNAVPVDDAAEQQEQWSFVQAGDWLSEVLKGLRQPEQLAGGPWGKHFTAKLRPYQETGARWLCFLSGLGLGACLADDMGLGKTIQLLAVISRLKSELGTTASLLVVPASLLGNWRAEMARFAPELRCIAMHPSETSKDKLTELGTSYAEELKKTDLVITTYSMLHRHQWLREVEWQLVVLDEAQAIKNPSSRQTKSVKKLKAKARIALTGTPIENRLGDLWSLFDFLCPGLLGSPKKFQDLVKQLNGNYTPLRRLVQPYILRRLKTDKSVISDLPDKTEIKAYCGLSKTQAVTYSKLVKEMTKALEGLDGIKRSGLVLNYLMRFKQLCNHPDHLQGVGSFEPQQSGKFLRLEELSREIAARQEKVLIFTQFRTMVDPLLSFLTTVFGRSGLVLHGGTPVGKRKKLVDCFQNDPAVPFFVLSLKAGGTGLNLTAASQVIHFDRWWNPAVENQATDRAFRIGQKSNVLVHKFVCRGTIEERIDELIEEKSGLAGELLDGGTDKILTELSDKELLRLVQIDIERAQI